MSEQTVAQSLELPLDHESVQLNHHKPCRLLILLYFFSILALGSLIFYLIQTERNQQFSQAASNIQLRAQQAVRDAALAAFDDQAALTRFGDETQAIDQDLTKMHQLAAHASTVNAQIARIETLWHGILGQLTLADTAHSPATANQAGATGAVAADDHERPLPKVNEIVAATDATSAAAGQAASLYRTYAHTAPALLLAVLATVVSMLLIIVISKRKLQAASQRMTAIGQENLRLLQASEHSQQRFSVIEQTHAHNQQAILHLLDELSDLSDGDLTVKAQVSDNITGEIADAINYTIDRLRDLVEEINRASEQVNQAAAQTQATSRDLLAATTAQSQHIIETGEAVQQMTRSILDVSGYAQQASSVAGRSLQTASQGAQAVQSSIIGMNDIRRQIQATAKRIKRLGESSQEIGEIVELIADITGQTNILALNAAIQAAAAGEAGRGFSLVAEEVQRLAERSSTATGQIAAIVKTIQADTHSAVAAMEKSTAGVVEGTHLSDAAGQTLHEIETVTHQLADLIQAISSATVAQTEVAASVSRHMQQIQNITSQTRAGTEQTAQSVGHLTALADALRNSVAGFKLS